MPSILKALPTVWNLNNHLIELMLELAALQMIHNVKCLLSQQPLLKLCFVPLVALSYSESISLQIQAKVIMRSKHTYSGRYSC